MMVAEQEKQDLLSDPILHLQSNQGLDQPVVHVVRDEQIQDDSKHFECTLELVLLLLW
jgi:hypothetical protein